MKKHRSFLTLACAAAAAILFLFTGADAKAAGAASLSSALIQGNQVVVTGTCSVSSEDGVLHLYAQAPYESGAQGLEVAQAPNGTATFAFPLNKNTANSNLYKKIHDRSHSERRSHGGFQFCLHYESGSLRHAHGGEAGRRDQGDSPRFPAFERQSSDGSRRPPGDLQSSAWADHHRRRDQLSV